MSTNQTTAGEVMYRTNRRKFLSYLSAAPRWGGMRPAYFTGQTEWRGSSWERRSRSRFCGIRRRCTTRCSPGLVYEVRRDSGDDLPGVLTGGTRSRKVGRNESNSGGEM